MPKKDHYFWYYQVHIVKFLSGPATLDQYRDIGRILTLLTRALRVASHMYKQL